MLAVGERVPEFEGTTSEGKPFRLAEVRGHPLVIYFYPKADTPGCTMEAKGFRDHLDELGARDVRVIGISVDTVEDERRFAQKYGLTFPLVADPDGAIARQFGVLGNHGVARRITFLVGSDGRVVQVIDSMLPGRHVSGACETGWGSGK